MHIGNKKNSKKKILDFTGRISIRMSISSVLPKFGHILEPGKMKFPEPGFPNSSGRDPESGLSGISLELVPVPENLSKANFSMHSKQKKTG